MDFIDVMFLLFGLYFVFKAFTAPNWRGSSDRRRKLNAFGEDAGKIDCIILAVLMFIGLFIGLFV